MLRRLRLALSTSSRTQFWLLWTFFFCAETSSYLMGVLSATLLVKRVGAAVLPQAYLWLNAAFLPIVLAVLARPPRSSFRAVQFSLAGYLLAVLALLAASTSSHPAVLVAMYVVARLGKLVWSTFAVGMVAEILPLREAKKAIPVLLAGGSVGIVGAGLALNPTLGYLGVGPAFAGLWLILAAAMGALLLLRSGVADELPATSGAAAKEGGGRPGKRVAYGTLGSIWTTLRGLLDEPLARVIAIQNLFVVGLRYFIEFAYVRELGQRFATESAMAGFAGTFEATLQVTTTVVQLSLAGYLMRTIRVGGVALLLPALLAVTTAGASLTGGFIAVMICQFLFWVGSDGFNKPVRQIMLGALPPARAASAPVLMSALGMTGSFAASAALVPLAWVGDARVVMGFTCLMSVVFLVLSLGIGRAYREALSRTLHGLDARGQEQVLSAYREGAQRYAALATMLESADPGLRFRAVTEAATLPAQDGSRLLVPLVDREPDPKVRAAALSALAVWQPPGFQAMLAQALKDADPRIRANALEAMADLRDRESALPLLQPALESADHRERAAAVLVSIRLGSEPGVLGRSVDTLIEMLSDEAEPRARRAAVFVVGRLGYPFLLPALERALTDADPGVRSTAVEASLRIHTPAAQRALAAAARQELDPQLAARMREALSHLQDDNVRAVLEVQGRLTSEERAKIGQLVAAGEVSDRMELLRRAVLVTDANLRAAVVALLGQGLDPELYLILGKCLRPGDPERELSLAPLLDHLAGKSLSGPSGGSEALGRLALHGDAAELEGHLTACARRLWTLALLEEHTSRVGDEKLAAELSTRCRSLLDHLLSVSSMLTRSPEHSMRVMRAALAGDRYLSSISVELVEQWMPARLRDILTPILEAFPDRGRRGAQDRRALSIPEHPSALESFCVQARNEEGL